MRVLLFGASGMVGQGVLRESILDPAVESIVSVVRRPSAPILGRRSQKLRELVAPDLFDLSKIEGSLTGFDACFFLIGVSSFRMKEDDYRRLTLDLTSSIARTLLRLNPTTAATGMTFVYVSGAGTDSTASGRTMWARVKGATENALLGMGFRAAYMFRPGLIVALHGSTSKTPAYRTLYAIMRPAMPLLLRLFPRQVITTEQIGRAMLAVAKHGYSTAHLAPADIAKAAEAARLP